MSNKRSFLIQTIVHWELLNARNVKLSILYKELIYVPTQGRVVFLILPAQLKDGHPFLRNCIPQ